VCAYVGALCSVAIIHFLPGANLNLKNPFQTQSSPRYLQNVDNNSNNNERLQQILKGSGAGSAVTQLNWPQPPKQTITDVKTELLKLNNSEWISFNNRIPYNNLEFRAQLMFTKTPGRRTMSSWEL